MSFAFTHRHNFIEKTKSVSRLCEPLCTQGNCWLRLNCAKRKRNNPLIRRKNYSICLRLPVFYFISFHLLVHVVRVANWFCSFSLSSLSIFRSPRFALSFSSRLKVKEQIIFFYLTLPIEHILIEKHRRSIYPSIYLSFNLFICNRVCMRVLFIYFVMRFFFSSLIRSASSIFHTRR